ncbi:hypothetical protein [Arthrobacter sp. H41]|uniref:hypothetical protein n=1 Tax=Arthrobacter sp. H41 TaxID=1312978 RepID=UPI0004796A50|nr:hypothetical protein [Arthrobacter sp. H41]
MDASSFAEFPAVPIVVTEVGPLEADPAVQLLPTLPTGPGPEVPANAVIAFSEEHDSSYFEKNLTALRPGNSLPGTTVTGVAEPLPPCGWDSVSGGINGDGD